MIQTGLISPAHDDLICDAAFDYYGVRLATCGLDQKIKIWRNQSEGEPSWVLEDEWKAHDATICALSWAHPEFGSMIASCSFDRTVKVWEQIPSFLVEEQQNGTRVTRWKAQAVLPDAKGSVRAVQFAPSTFGLRLASLATDNTLRIYESADLQQFNLVDSIDVTSLPTTPSSTPHTANILLMTPTQTTASLDGTSTSPSGLGTLAGSSVRPGIGIKEADGGWTISWCKDYYWGQVLAVGCGTNGTVKIVQISTPEQQTHTLLTLDPYSSSKTSSTADPSSQPPVERTFSVTSVSWAPSCGRSYHLIAAGSRDGHVRIWKVKAPAPLLTEDENGKMISRERGSNEQWTANLAGDFEDHQLSVSRVEWNITGTVLSSSGNDGKVRLWKATMGGVWRPMGSISTEQTSDSDKKGDNAMEES